MQLRRVIGLVAFVASLWIGLIGVRSWRADPNSIGGLVGILLLGGGALFGLLIAITLFFGGTPRHDYQESGYLSEGARKPFLVTVLLAFGAIFVYLGVRGIVQRHMPDIGEHPDAVFAATPIRFVLLFAFWCGLGLLLGWGALRGRRAAAMFDAEEGDPGAR